jgi:hypothetical protein
MKQQPLDPYLSLHAKANDKTMQSHFKRGVINVVYPSSATADIQIVGNVTTVVKGIQLSSGINPRAIKSGDRVFLWQFDETNPNDMIAVSCYGRAFTDTTNGVISVTVLGGSNVKNFSIPHNLGVVPTMAMVSTFNYAILSSSPGGTGVTSGTYISATGPNGVTADSTYIYGTAFASGDAINKTFPVYWFASIT